MADAYHYFGECGGPEKCEFCASVEGRVAAMDRLAEVEAVARQLAAALTDCDRSCEHVHHAHRDRHELDQDCPVVGRIDDALAAFRAAFPEEPDAK